MSQHKITVQYKYFSTGNKRTVKNMIFTQQKIYKYIHGNRLMRAKF